MTKRAMLTFPAADLQKPHQMTIDGGITTEELQRPTPEHFPADSDPLSSLSSYSATPPSPRNEKEPFRKAETCDPRG